MINFTEGKPKDDGPYIVVIEYQGKLFYEVVEVIAGQAMYWDNRTTPCKLGTFIKYCALPVIHK
jgi:hypothetical protein